MYQNNDLSCKIIIVHPLKPPKLKLWFDIIKNIIINVGYTRIFNNRAFIISNETDSSALQFYTSLFLSFYMKLLQNLLYSHMQHLSYHKAHIPFLLLKKKFLTKKVSHDVQCRFFSCVFFLFYGPWLNIVNLL